MGSSSRRRPKRLAAKLFAIRKHLGLTQSQMIFKLDELYIYPSHISDYERGEREPNLLVLLKYARLAQVPMEMLIDDAMNLPGDMHLYTKTANILIKRKPK
jgi:transcriptional regulator with XRE-family HTH domain